MQKTHEQYEQQLLDREIDFYPLEQYIAAKKPILHACIKGHEWNVRPDDILKGRGCPLCSTAGFKYDKPASMYFISLKDRGKIIYKLGVTNKTLKERFGPEWVQLEMKCVWFLSFSTGYEAFEQEQKLKQKYSDYLVETNVLRKGNTETFSIPISKPNQS